MSSACSTSRCAARSTLPVSSAIASHQACRNLVRLKRLDVVDAPIKPGDLTLEERGGVA